jgi:gamma-glutamylcyclotransferase (GGCT)/AIG2-like uncharacterized protein YtfP
MVEHLKDKLCDDDLVNAPKVLRSHIYVQKPVEYEIECLLCGGSNIEWSEFESHIWCCDCEKDVLIPQSYSGIFGGPIPMGISQMLGLSFDRVSVDGKHILKYDGQVELDYEKKINKERYSKLEGILSEEIVRWEDTWIFNKELNKYKTKIENKLFDKIMMKLFIYGDLQKPEIQQKIFEYDLPTVLSVDSISNWMVLNVFKEGRNYLQLHSQPSGIVFGRVLELNGEQISKLDKYEKDYFRFTLKTDNGVEVEAYTFENKY